MKLAIASLLLAGCFDEQNVGNSPAPTLTPMFNSVRWAISIGGSASDTTSKVEIDPEGNVIAFGDFNGLVEHSNDAVDFGGSIHSAPNGGSWISKRAAADGHEIWTRTFGDAASLVGGLSGAVGPDGSVIVTASFDGDLSVGTTVYPGPALHSDLETFLAKYSSDGELIWSFVIGQAARASVYQVAVGNDGHIAIAGNYQGTITFPNGTFTASDGNYPDIFVALLDSDGHEQWGTSSSLPGKTVSPASIAMTVEDDVVIASDLYGTARFAGATVQGNAQHNELVARFTVTGQPLWARVLESSGDYIEPGQIAVGPGGALIAASTQKTGPFGAPRIDRLDAAGNTMWTNVAPGAASLAAMTVTHDGTIVTGGFTSGADLDLGSGTIDTCTYLAAHDESGDLTAVGTFGPRVPPYCKQTIPFSFASAPATIALGGVLGTSADLGTGALRFAGATDALIAVYDTP